MAVLIWIATFATGTAYYIFLLAYDDNPPLVVNDHTVQFVHGPGNSHFIESTLDLCKRTLAPAEIRVSLQLVDGSVRYALPTMRPPNAGTGCNVITAPISVPADIREGTYVMHQTFVYQVNPVAVRTVEVFSPPFYVDAHVPGDSEEILPIPP